MARPDAIVVGSGPSGLAAAFRLEQAGRRVLLLERAAAVGGKLRSKTHRGFVLDQGAFFMPTTHRELLAIAAEAGFGEALAPGGFVLGLHRDGVIHEIDGNHPVRDFLRTRALSRRGKVQAARLAPELLKSRVATFARMPETARYDTASVEGWTREHLSPEVSEYLVGTMMRAMFNCDLRVLPRVDFLAILAFFRGAKLGAYPTGMSYYSERVAARCSEVRTGAEVVAVEETAEGVRVSSNTADGGVSVDTAAGCVLAVPATTALEVHPGIDPWRREHMGRVKRGGSLVVSIGLRRPPAGIRSAYVMIAPPSHPFVVGIGFDHNKASGRVPPGKGLLTVATLAQWFDERREDDDETIAAAVLEGVEQLVAGGIRDDVEFTMVHRWEQEFNPVGYYRDLERFRSLCEQTDRRIQLAGDYHSSQSLNAATCAGERAAGLLERHLG